MAEKNTIYYWFVFFKYLYKINRLKKLIQFRKIIFFCPLIEPSSVVLDLQQMDQQILFFFHSDIFIEMQKKEKSAAVKDIYCTSCYIFHAYVCF